METQQFVICENSCNNTSKVALLKPNSETFLNEQLSKNDSASWNVRTAFYTNETFSELYNFDRTFENGTILNCTFDNGTCSDVQNNYNLWALSLLVFPLLTLFGNVLVILSVAREKSLQTATNYFIVSLAVADLLVAVVVMPFGVYYLFNGIWGLPAVVCDCYIAMDVTCSTSSIFNLVAISVDRYIAVTQPIKYAKPKGNARVWCMIGVAWLVSCAIGSPVVLGLNNTPDRNHTQCLFNNTDYVIFSSLGSFYIPCIIMMFLYYKIFKAIRERAKKQRSAKKNTRGLASVVASGASAVVIENIAQTQKFDSSMDDKPTNTASGSNEEDDDENFDKTEMKAYAEELANTTTTRFMLAAVVEETGLSEQSYYESEVDDPIPELKKIVKTPVKRKTTVDKSTSLPKKKPAADTSKAAKRSASEATPTATSSIMANLASPIPMVDPNTNNDSGYAPSNPDGETKEHTPPPSPIKERDDKSEKENEDTQEKEIKKVEQEPNGAPKKVELKKKLSQLSSSVGISTPKRRFRSAVSATRFTIFSLARDGNLRAKSIAKREKKATQTLAIVLGVFLFCWAPFFTCNVWDGISIKFNLPYSPGVTVFILTTWLGYINSFLNPVIYTIFNPEFRKAFRRILNCST